MIELSLALAGLNVVLIAVIVRLILKQRNLASRPESVELQEFLMDLMSGGALVHVKRVAPVDIVMRSRRK